MDADRRETLHFPHEMQSYMVDGNEFSTLEEFSEHFSQRCSMARIDGAGALMHSTTSSEADSVLRRRGSAWSGSILNCRAIGWDTPKHRVNWNSACGIATQRTELQLAQSLKTQKMVRGQPYSIGL